MVIDYDVRIAGVDRKVDWRAGDEPDPDDEELLISPADVVGMLGFDPLKLDEQLDEGGAGSGNFGHSGQGTGEVGGSGKGGELSRKLLYHGTTEQYVKEIEQKGLIPQHHSGVDQGGVTNAPEYIARSEGHVFFTQSSYAAAVFADYAAKANPGSKPVIIEIRITKEYADRLEKDPNTKGQSLSSLRLKGAIPPHALKVVKVHGVKIIKGRYGDPMPVMEQYKLMTVFIGMAVMDEPAAAHEHIHEQAADRVGHDPRDNKWLWLKHIFGGDQELYDNYVKLFDEARASGSMLPNEQAWIIFRQRYRELPHGWIEHHAWEALQEGGAGSGNFGHSGQGTGEVGGSGKGEDQKTFGDALGKLSVSKAPWAENTDVVLTKDIFGFSGPKLIFGIRNSDKKKFSLRDMPLDNLAPMQADIAVAGLKAYSHEGAKTYDTDPPILALFQSSDPTLSKLNGRYLILSGHTRLAVAILKGKKTHRVQVARLRWVNGNPIFSKLEERRYDSITEDVTTAAVTPLLRARARLRRIKRVRPRLDEYGVVGMKWGHHKADDEVVGDGHEPKIERGILVLHGTTVANLSSILSQGIRSMGDGSGVYVTTTKDRAMYYAEMRSEQTGSIPAIVHLFIPAGVKFRAVGHHLPGEPFRIFGKPYGYELRNADGGVITTGIPREWIKGYTLFNEGKETYKKLREAKEISGGRIVYLPMVFGSSKSVHTKLSEHGVMGMKWGHHKADDEENTMSNNEAISRLRGRFHNRA